MADDYLGVPQCRPFPTRRFGKGSGCCGVPSCFSNMTGAAAPPFTSLTREVEIGKLDIRLLDVRFLDNRCEDNKAVEKVM